MDQPERSKMSTEMRDGGDQVQQQQGTKTDLTQQYQAIGIPALNAANMYKKTAVKKPASQPQMGVEFED